MICIDTETTGLDKENDEILQLSVMNEKEQILLNQYFKPVNKTEWNEEMKINKITPEMVKDCPTIEDCKEQIQDIFSKETTVIGYNTFFDIDFIKNNKIKIDENINVIDVMLDFANMYNEYDSKHGGVKWKKLTFAADFYDFKWDEKAHNSLGDIKATLYVYNKLQERQRVLNGPDIKVAEDYAMKEIAKKIVMKYNKDFEKGEFTIQNLNETFDFYKDMTVCVQDLIVYTLHTNYYPQNITFEFDKQKDMKHLLTKIDLQSCLDIAYIRHDFKKALEETDNVFDISYKLKWSFTPGDLNQLAIIHRDHPNLREKIFDLLEDSNFHSVNTDFVIGDYDKYLINESEDIQMDQQEDNEQECDENVMEL